MRMKRLLAWLLAAIVLSCACVGCGWEAADKAGHMPGTGPGLTYRATTSISNSFGQRFPVTNRSSASESYAIPFKTSV